MVYFIVFIFGVIVLILATAGDVKKKRTIDIPGYGYTDKVVVPDAYNDKGEIIKFYVKDAYLCNPIGIDFSWKLQKGESLKLEVKDDRLAVMMDSYKIGYVDDEVAKKLIPIMDSFVDCKVLYCGRSGKGSFRSSYDSTYVEVPTISAVAFFNKHV